MAKQRRIMDKNTRQQLSILILKILLEETNGDDSVLTHQEICEKLNKQYSIVCDPRTVRSVIESLSDLCEKGYLDFDVLFIPDNDEDELCKKSENKKRAYDKNKNQYCIRYREFADSELRVIIDGILNNKDLSKKETQEIIRKVAKLTNKTFLKTIPDIVNLDSEVFRSSNYLSVTIEDIHNAISKKQMISFIYNKYGIDKKMHPKREKRYFVNPYQIVIANGFYYLIGNYEGYEDISHYRIDKMSDVKIEARNIEDTNRITEYCEANSIKNLLSKQLYMYSGEIKRIVLLVKVDILDEIVDWFGKDFDVLSSIDSQGYVKIAVRTNEQAMQYWALQYACDVEVLEPISLRTRIKDAIKELNRKYT